MALAAHLYGPLVNLPVIDVFAFFPLKGIVAMAGISAIAAMGFFFLRHNQDCFFSSFSSLS